MNPRPLFAVLLLLCTPGPVGAEPKPFEKHAKTFSVKKPPPLRVAHKLPEGVKASATMGVCKAKVGKVQLLFVDVDGNGAFDDAGVDGWTFERMPAKARMHYVFPHAPSLVLGANVAHYRVAKDGSGVDFTLTKPKLSAAVRAGVEMLNRLRVRNALPPVPVDATRSKACAKHINYMIVNDAYGHAESADKKGWSEDGAYAGIHSVIDALVGLDDASIRWFATLYHRWPISDPRVTSVGAGTGGSYAMFSSIRDMKDQRWAWPVIVPAPDSEDQPTTAGRERPLPYPPGESVGYPITLQFPAWTSAVTKVKAALRLKGPKGTEVPCYVTSPLNPANPSRDRNDGNICLLAKQPLKAKTLYWVQVDYEWNGEKEQRTWSFRTGRARELPEGYRKK